MRIHRPLRAEAVGDDRALELRDGRLLGYAGFGDPTGKPVLYFHGHPGSRLEPALLHEAAAAAGVRLIGSDRPGMGLSTFQRDRHILDWPADVEELADALELERFAVAGGSGGGPYAAACALSIPERLTGCGLISSAAPPGLARGDGKPGEIWINRVQRLVARHAPWALEPAFAVLARWLRARSGRMDIARLGRGALRSFPEVDRRALARPPQPERFGESLLAAFARGSRGVAWEARLLYRDWGFKLSQIDCANVHVWHGGLDRNIPIAAGRALVAEIAGAQAHFYSEDGHLSVALDHFDDVVGVLLAGG